HVFVCSHEIAVVGHGLFALACQTPGCFQHPTPRGAAPRMSNSDLTSILLILLLLVALAQLLGYLFTRLRQPKVVGEILAGVILGPLVFGRLRLGTGTLADLTTHHATILNFVYW